MPEQSQVDLVIYDVLGRKVRSLAANSFYQTGTHKLTWDGAGDSGNVLASGVYFYEVKAVPVSAGNIYRETRKLVFIQ